MPRKAYSFPSEIRRGPDIYSSPAYREDDGFMAYVRERSRQAKYSGAMLAELFAAGEITKEQYERLRRKSR